MDQILRRSPLKSICKEYERNRYNTMLKFRKNDYLHRIITAKSKDTRMLFKLVSEITGCNKPNPMPDAPNDKELAENFSQFLKQKIDKIRNQFKDTPQYKVPQRHQHLNHLY